LNTAAFFKDSADVSALIAREHGLLRPLLQPLNPGAVLWLSSHSLAPPDEPDYARPHFFLQLQSSEQLSGACRTATALLPFADGALSAVVLQHILEFIEEPETLLAECARVLRGDGMLVLAGFRPMSPVRLRKSWRNRAPRWVRANTWISVLRALGFREFSLQRFAAFWPMLSAHADQPPSWHALERMLPSMNSAYVLSARKRDVRMLLSLAGSAQRLRLAGVSAPSVRIMTPSKPVANAAKPQS
jgi:SAM-dependent methyltransferase